MLCLGNVRLQVVQVGSDFRLSGTPVLSDSVTSGIAVQQRLDEDPQAMRRRRETVEHPFGTLKMRMGATHFLMKTLPKVASEMALSVLAYNLTRVMNIVGTRALLAAIRA